MRDRVEEIECGRYLARIERVVEGSFEIGDKFAVISASLCPDDADADSAGLGYTARGGQIYMHYPKAVSDGIREYGSGFPLARIPERHRSAPPSEITAEWVALWDELLARQPGKDT